MMAVRIEKLLKRYLDELNDETLREFQWYARWDGKIPWRKLDNITREDTVDSLVQVHGEDEAASTTVNIFLDIRQNNLADKLIQALLDRSTDLEKQPVVSTVRPSQRDEFPIGSHDLSCTICLLLFNDPVVLQCGHSFCKICVHEEWSEKETRKCPLCQKVLPKTEPAINYNLRGLCETYREKSPAESCQTPSVSIREKQEVSEKGQQFSDPIVTHIKVRPLSTSIRKKREVFEKGRQFFDQFVEHIKTLTLSTSVRERREVFEKCQQFSDPFVERVKTQGSDAEKRIKDDFKELRRLLRTMEEARLEALEREKTNKVCLLEKVAEQSRALASLATTLEISEDMRPDDEFTQNTRTLLERAHRVLTDPQNHEPSQINVSEHVQNLQSRVCRELLDAVEDNPENHEPSQINVSERVQLLQTTFCEEPMDFVEYNYVEDRKSES